MYKNFRNKPLDPKPLSKTPAFEPAPVPPEWVDPTPTPSGEEAGYDFVQDGSAGAFNSAAFAPAGGTAVVTRNVLNSDVSVKGILRFTDDLLVDGSVEGEITSDGVLTVGANAIIVADDNNKVAVRTQSAIIHGRVTGDVEVMDRVELTSTAVLHGNVKASKISIQEGAVFVGYCAVGAMESLPAAPAPRKGKGKADDSLLG